jgi:hypothetical protein
MPRHKHTQRIETGRSTKLIHPPPAAVCRGRVLAAERGAASPWPCGSASAARACELRNPPWTSAAPDGGVISRRQLGQHPERASHVRTQQLWKTCPHPGSRSTRCPLRRSLKQMLHTSSSEWLNRASHAARSARVPLSSSGRARGSWGISKAVAISSMCSAVLVRASILSSSSPRRRARSNSSSARSSSDGSLGTMLLALLRRRLELPAAVAGLLLVVPELPAPVSSREIIARRRTSCTSRRRTVALLSPL